MQHLEGLHLQIVPQHLVHGGFAHTGCGGQGSAASARISSQLFPRVFEVLRDDVGVKSFKMRHRQELTDSHVAMRAQKYREILHEMADGTLPNLVFADEKKFDIQQVVSQ